MVEAARVDADTDALTVRVAAGAERTADVRHGAEKRTQDPESVFSDRGRLVAANTAAAAYFVDQAAGSWVPDYLTARLGTAELPAGSGTPPPAGPT